MHIRSKISVTAGAHPVAARSSGLARKRGPSISPSTIAAYIRSPNGDPVVAGSGFVVLIRYVNSGVRFIELLSLRLFAIGPEWQTNGDNRENGELVPALDNQAHVRSTALCTSKFRKRELQVSNGIK
jgi:hypothetical protein